MTVRPLTVRENTVRGAVRGALRGGGGGLDPLVFHALDTVDGAFVNDVIVGTGVLTEANTSTRYYADDSTPAVWQSFGSGVAGKVYAGAKWWLVGQAAHTNLQIYSKDLTNAEWTATNMTVAFTAEGMTGAANDASDLTATAANATVIANTITAASADQTTRWFLKRKTGTGVVEITVDNGTTWQDVTTEVDSTTGFNEAIESLAATVDIRIGIRLVTSGDAVYAGNAEGMTATTEAALRQSSPLFTAGSAVTINASDLSFDDANHSDTEGGYYCEFRNAGLTATLFGGLIGLGSIGRVLFTQSALAIKSYDGTVAQALIGPDFLADDQEYQFGMAYGDSLQRVNADGSWGTAVAYSGAYTNSENKINVLHWENTVAAPITTMLIRDLRRYDQSYAAAQTTIDGLMS